MSYFITGQWKNKCGVFMLVLCTVFSNAETECLKKFIGDKYEILNQIGGECFALCDKGEYKYNQCFQPVDNEYSNKQFYEKMKPYRVIRFHNIYLMNPEDEKDSWYRGRKDIGGNFEFDCFADGLEEILEFL